MSVRTAPSRRPSTAHATTNKPPFLDPQNEVLLWAKQLQRQHGELLLRMNKVQDQHEAFNSRLQATESIANTITSETFKIDDVERRVAALTNKDGEFEAWVGGSIKKLERSIGDNTKLQQRMHEIETRYSAMKSQMEKMTFNQRAAIEGIEALRIALRDLNGENGDHEITIRGLLRRIEVLEQHLKDGDRQVESLKDTVTEIGGGLRQPTGTNDKTPFPVAHQNDAGQQRALSVISEATTDTELESVNLKAIEEIQVPRTPEHVYHPPNTMIHQNARQKVSARVKLMQRPSIPDENTTESHIERQPIDHELLSTSRRRGEPVPRSDPGIKPNPNKRRRVVEASTQRQTRSQAKAAAEDVLKKGDNIASDITSTADVLSRKANEPRVVVRPLSSPQKKQALRLLAHTDQGNVTSESSFKSRSPGKVAAITTKQSYTVGSANTSNVALPKRKRNPHRRVIPDYPGF